MYDIRLRAPRIRSHLGYGQLTPKKPGSDWKDVWPFRTSIIIGVILVNLSLIILGLEVASLNRGSSTFYGNTSATGSGIWGGFFIFWAGGFMIIISNKKFFI